MQPIVHGLETEFVGQLAFEERNANTEVGKTTMRIYNLRAHPSYALVAPDGKLLWSLTGQVSTDMLRVQLRRYTKQ